MTADNLQTPERRLENNDASREQVDSRTRLSQTMLDGVNPGDRVVQAAQPTDRATFRADIAQRVQTMEQSLHAASDGMKQFNLAAQSGQLRPGSPEYIQAFQQAAGGYKQAIEQAANQLLQPDSTGKPSASDLSKQVAAEQQQVVAEKRWLKQMAQAGQDLTPEQAQALGVKSTKASDAFAEKKQQGETLSDFQRSLAYAQANFGLALIRSSAGMPDNVKQAQVAEGEKMIQSAGGMDSKMASDSNFWAHYINDYQKAGLRPPRQLPQSLDRRDPDDNIDAPARPAAPGAQGDGGDRPNLPGQATPQNNNRYRLPRDHSNPDQDGFVDPHTLLKKADDQVRAETSSGAKLTPDDIANYKAAISAADKIDRDYLESRMPQEQAFLKAKLNGDQTGQLRSRVQTEDTLFKTLPEADKGIRSLAASVAKTAGDGVPGMVEEMRQMQSVADLQKFAQDNQDLINLISKAPGGQQLFNQLKTRVSVQEKLNTLDQEIKQIDPEYSQIQSDLNRHQRLYLSSIDTRMHALAALDAHIQEDPTYPQAARELVLQMAGMDRGLPKQTDFLQAARKFGVTPEDLNRVVTGQMKPGDQTNTTELNPPGIKPDSSDNATPPEKALALYNLVMKHVRQGQPISDQEQSQFEDLIKQAGNLDPDAVKAQDEKLKQQSTQIGGGKPVEQNLQELMQSKAPNAQQALADYAHKPDVADYLQKRQRFDVAVHGDKVTEGIYGLALLRGSKDQDKQEKAKVLLTDAAADKVAQQVLNLNNIMNQLSSPNGVASELGTPAPGSDKGTPPADKGQNPAQPQQNPLYKYVPGLENLDNAEKILSDKSLSAGEALEKARADLDKATQLTEQIKPQDEQAKFADPRAMVKDGKYTDEAIVAQYRAGAPTRARMLYSIALNHAAVDLYDQAKKDPAHEAELQKRADDLNNQAIGKLQEIGKRDNQFGVLDPGQVQQASRTVDGFIIQAQRHEALDGKTAAARSFGESAKTGVSVGLRTFSGPVDQPSPATIGTGVSPVSFAVNAVDMAVPLFPTPSSEMRQEVVQKLTNAKLNDADTAQKIVDEGKQAQKNTWAHTIIDLVSGPTAIYAAENAAPMLAKFIPNPAVRWGAQALLAGAADLGLTKGGDWVSNKVFGTDELTNDQLYSHSLASLGTAGVLRGAVALQSRFAANAIAEGTTAKALTGLNPKLAGSMQLNGETEAAKAYQLSQELRAASGNAQDAVVGARTRQYWIFQKGQWAGDVKVDEGMVKAAKFSEPTPEIGQSVSMKQFVKNETGAELGSFSSYLNPKNVADGFMQRTLQVGEDGKLVGTIRDLNSRLLWSKVAPAAAAGGVGAAVYSNADVNPWLKKSDGTYFSGDEWAKSMGYNGAAGALASGVFAPAVPAIANMTKSFLITEPAALIGRGAKWVAPAASEAIATSGPVQAVKSFGQGVGTRLVEGRNWVTNPSSDLNTIMKAAPSLQNGVNVWARAYAPSMSLPIYNGVLNPLYGQLYEWDYVNRVAERAAKAQRDEDAEREEKAKAAAAAAKNQPGRTGAGQ